MRKRRETWKAAYDHWLASLWAQEKRTVADIAQQMDFSPRAIRAAAERLGLPGRKPGRPKGQTSDKERNDQIRLEAGAGVSEGTLMNKYGLSSRRIKQILKRNG